MAVPAPLHGLLRRLRSAAEPEPIGLICAEAPATGQAAAPATWIRLDRCVGALAVVDILELFSGGVPVVALRREGCADPAAVDILAAQVAALLDAGRADAGRADAGRRPSGRLLIDPPAPRRGGRAVEYPLASLPMTRRTILGLAGRSRPAADDPAALAPTGIGERTRVALRGLGVERGPEVPAPALDLEVRGCTGCGVCERVCPAGALTVHTQPAAAGTVMRRLRYDPAACSGCRRCLAHCPADAIRAPRALTWQDVVATGRRTAALVPSAVCERCGAGAPVGSRRCELCSFREANPFGYTDPGAERT